jgi:hypothetical protein
VFVHKTRQTMCHHSERDAVTLNMESYPVEQPRVSSFEGASSLEVPHRMLVFKIYGRRRSGENLLAVTASLGSMFHSSSPGGADKVFGNMLSQDRT